MKNIYNFILCFAALGLIFTGCTTNDQESVQYSIKLVDAPGDYEEVNIDVQGIEVIVNGEPIQLDVEPKVIDLLQLTGGVSELLADGEFPVGQISQIRLILGENNTVVVQGEAESHTYDLFTPSAQQTGVKLVVAKKLEAGVRYDFILDFNVAKSILKTQSPQAEYALKPVVRVTTEAETGAISGAVSATGGQTLVTAASTTDTISSYTHETTGEFLLYAVPAGNYKLTVDENLVKENVEVATGVTTNVGEISVE